MRRPVPGCPHEARKRRAPRALSEVEGRAPRRAAGVSPRRPGSAVTVNAMGGKVMIDGANVVTTDIAASNGVIHVIDTVLMPK